jgi:glutaminase
MGFPAVIQYVPRAVLAIKPLARRVRSLARFPVPWITGLQGPRLQAPENPSSEQLEGEPAINDCAASGVTSHPAIELGLASVFESCRPQAEGQVASYIPELATVDPDKFGIALATIDGRLWTCGDAEFEFTIQSISKAFSYCVALELLGRDEVFKHVGVEPSGDAFNAIIFDPRTQRPFNPMVNAGAITVSALIRRVWQGEALDFLLDRFSKAAGRSLRISESVYRSEAETGHRNRAIGHLLLNVGAAEQPIEPALDLYFRQCSILVTASDLARMGATLANIGENPFTGESVFDVAAVRDTLSVMFTCGMYDYSGSWALDVGIPAKSGVGGGVLGVVNRQLGIGTYSPRLDEKGNSVRGLSVFQKLSEEFGLHAFECTNYGSELMRSLV